jgi:mono/diheme cytochrome c family protein
MRAFVLGIVCTLAVIVAGGLAAVFNGWIPANADGPYLPGEEWAAKKSLNATIRREMPQGPPPVASTSDNLISGIKLYGENCMVCHGASDANPTNIVKGFYQEAPQLAKDGVEDDPPGETFWKIRHGIRFTAMPSFGKTLSDLQMWQLSLFLKQMDKLPPDAAAEWKALRQTTPQTALVQR